jgi:hypothetical protein
MTYLGAVIGCLVLAGRKSVYALALLLLPLIYLLILPGAASNPRFRIPVMPYLCLLAGVGIVFLYLKLFGAIKSGREGLAV